MADGSVVHVTCSVGLALHPRDGRSGKALLRAADAAMYSAQALTRRPWAAAPCASAWRLQPSPHRPSLTAAPAGIVGGAVGPDLSEAVSRRGVRATVLCKGT